MAKTSGKLVTRSVLEELREELRKRAKIPVPKPERYTRTQIAGELDAEIQELLKAGYGLSQIAAIFKEKGIEIGVATLRTRNRTQASGGTKGLPVERGGVK